MQNDTMTLHEVALLLNKKSETIAKRMRYCALHNVYFPLGFAVPPEDRDGQWMYVIPRQRVERYMSGADFAHEVQQDAGA